MKAVFTILMMAVLGAPAYSENRTATVGGINAFGLDFHRRLAKSGGNIVFSPWSIESALAMTYGGAGGKTRDEMAKVLRFSQADEATVHAGFSSLSADLARLGKGPDAPIRILNANRIFAQDGYPFRGSFLDLTRKRYGAPLQTLDLQSNPDAARKVINRWVDQQTASRIKDLLPPRSIASDTRMVLANAIYLKAPWADEFIKEPGFSFAIQGGKTGKVPGLVNTGSFGYQKIAGGAMVAVPYAGDRLRFLLMIPDEPTGLASLEKSLRPETLTTATKMPLRLVELHLPKFKLTPDSVNLTRELRSMGMLRAFDPSPGGADFSRMVTSIDPARSLCIGAVYHKAFIDVNEHGTEAAAATAVVMRLAGMPQETPKPLVIRVDRPFAFAIQHTASGTCLFLGRVVDPR